MMTEAPPALPRDDKPTKAQVRLRAVVNTYMEVVSNSLDRQRFAALQGLLVPPIGQHEEWRLPTGRQDGRADSPTRTAVVYARLLRAIRMIWNRASQTELEPVVTGCEDASCAEAGSYRFVGSVGEGFDMEMTK